MLYLLHQKKMVKKTKKQNKTRSSLYNVGSTQQEDITIVIIYIPNIGAPIYIKQKLTTKRRNKWQTK